ncbi:MAG: DUF5107 domain-containing protein [Ruminococcus sp.]|nr:DUF5107 domain-containing protein [Ruminococcus sp.]
MQKNCVRVWEETITLPTYQVSSPEKTPLFLENRAYQGSTGKVYPFPVTEKISDQKEDVPYHAVFLENDYLFIMILPELGGRIQRALDKTNQYDFVYYNHVIKPALVGLTGPWISGGIEFNWPQHHRPSTYSPVDFSFKENEDGSASVYVSEIDKMYGTKGMASFTLYPDKSYIEIKGRLFNRTDLPQTFLWWANPAVPVNDHTFSVFPPDVHAVMDHGKRAVSTFPIATGEYYKYDYSAGVDISCYRNIEVPTSYMAAHSDYDFIGNFDEKKDAGLLHVADHHVSPGKKQWTWGNSDFGQAWDRNLTDEDGPYIELMTGVYTDNQPDFTWLKPYEEKTFTQYFMPYKHVGRVKNATKDAALNLELDNNRCTIKVYASGEFPQAVITVEKDGKVLFSDTADLSPREYFEASFDTDLAELIGCTAKVSDKTLKELVVYTAKSQELQPAPDPAVALPAPSELKSTEELYLAATHLEQYRHATYRPEDYYLEGLRRDATDLRLNDGYGMLLYKQGRFEESISYFENAIQKQTWKNPNPASGEAYFHLGLALVMCGRDEEAFDTFYKSAWCADTQSGAFYWLSCLASRKGQYKEALEFIDQSLVRNWHNMRARTLKAALLRMLSLDNKAYIEEGLAIDPLDFGLLYEKGIAFDSRENWLKQMRTPAHNYLVLSLDYMKAGLYEDALAILAECKDPSPLAAYYQGYIWELKKDTSRAETFYLEGEKCDYSKCFPNQPEEILILEGAIRTLSEAPRAHYYLGCLLYDKRQYQEAASHWEQALTQDPEFAMASRNLAIYFYNKENDIPKALEYMKKAFELESNYSRFLLEYNQLLEKAKAPNEERLQLLSEHLELVQSRDALYVEYIALLNRTGQFDLALEHLSSHQFHPWEGGEGKVSTQYRYALIHKAIQLIEKADYDQAIDLLQASKTYPHNLGEGKLPGTQDAMADYYIGKAFLGKQDTASAEQYFHMAIQREEAPSSVLYYNDQPSDFIFYQALAKEALSDPAGAKKCYHQLLSFGRKHIFDQVDFDYFAVSLPEIEVFPTHPKERNRLYCLYLMALGNLGLSNIPEAVTLFEEILAAEPGHQGAIEHMEYINAHFLKL